MIFNKKKSREQRLIEQNKNNLRREIVRLTREGWKSEDIDLNALTATLTRSSMSTQRKLFRLGTFRFGAGKTDRVETMFIYVDEKGRVKRGKSKRNFS